MLLMLLYLIKKLYTTPILALSSASFNATKWTSSNVQRGGRMPGPIFPISMSALLTGMGLDSKNNRLCNFIRVSLTASASAFAPAFDSANMLCMDLGATLAVTLITPSPPTRTNSHPKSSSPLYNKKSLPHSLRSDSTRVMSPVASLTPITLGCVAISAMVSGFMSTPNAHMQCMYARTERHRPRKGGSKQQVNEGEYGCRESLVVY